MKPDFKKYPDGLVPAVVVDNQTQQVLMMAYVNEESFNLCMKTRQTWFWSRSRQELWHKGETSGNTQEIVSMEIDCDEDTLLMKVNPAGPACHTGHTSCFYRTILPEQVKEESTMQDLDELYQLILKRKNNPEKGSYTDYLFTKGLDKILKKVGEDATEVVVAAKNPSDPEFILEVADLAYHVEVLMAQRGITPDQIKKELAGREGKQSITKDRKEIKEW